MKEVKALDALLEFVFAMAFGVCLIIGVFLWPFFILAVVDLAAYILWNRKLRCPSCGASLESFGLLKNMGKGFNCPSCGEEIFVKPLNTGRDKKDE